ncbi:adenylate kinase [Horticoccus luteus]|uniref:Adenylate kinase n=2 Tax=Horticoccus luteus TaxID=2862869 RepID=A0A8F9TZ07_9BACT|nr:adenylate kinase [Horticoccus luteus]
MRQEISRRSPAAKANGDASLTLMRRWFWARKPDAGFVLTDFPATLLQAKVFDEWLDTRNEALDAVWVCPGLNLATALVDYYRDLGVLRDAGTSFAA